MEHTNKKKVQEEKRECNWTEMFNLNPESEEI